MSEKLSLKASKSSRKMTGRHPVASKAKKQRESTLMNELTSKHGYSLGGLPQKGRTALLFNFKTGTSRAMVCFKVMVPVESSMGAAFVAHYKKAKK